MNGGAVSLDTVMIKVESDAGKAGSNITNLSETLSKLKTSISGGFNNLNKLANSLKKLKESTNGFGTTVKNIAKLDEVTDTLSKLSSIQSPTGLSKTIKRLNELSETSKTLYNTAFRLSSIDKIIQPLQSLSTIESPKGLSKIVKDLIALNNLGSLDGLISEMSKIPQIVEPLSKLGTIINPKGFKTAVTNLGKLPEVINKFDTTTFENVKRVSEELAQSLTPLADKMMQVANGYSAFSKIQNTFGKSASTVTRYAKQQKSLFSSLLSIVKKVGSGFNTLRRVISSAFGKNTQSDLKSFYSKFKQIYLSLLGTRTIFTMVRKAASEYQAFDTTLQKFTTNIWRAFGAQLAPVIEYAMNLFKQFVRVIYSVVYALTGIDLIARANEKAMQAWGESAKDTLGNLQKFDDLNVVEFPKSTGDDKELIEMDKIDLSPIQKVIDWVKKLKEEIKDAIDTGKWYEVGKVFAEGINEGIEFLLSKIPIIRKKLFSIATGFGDILNGVIENVNWENFGKAMSELFKTSIDTFTKLFKKIKWKKIGIGLTNFIKGINLSSVVDSIINNLGTLTKGIEDAIHNVNWKIIGSELGKATLTLLKDLNNIIKKIDGARIGKDLKDLLLSIPWGDIFTEIINILISSLGALGEFLLGFTGIDALTSLMTTIQETSINIDWEGLSTNLDNLLKSLRPFAKNVGEGLEWFYTTVLVPLAEYVTNDLVPSFLELLSNVINTLSIILDASKPSVDWMWKHLLNPLLKVTEMIIIGLIDGLNKVFKAFSDWASQNYGIVNMMTDLIVDFLGTLFIYFAVKKITSLVSAFVKVLSLEGLTGALQALNVPLLITVAGFASLVWSIQQISENWSKMNGLEKVISILGALSIAAATAAVALGALQSAWSLGVAAVAIVAGIASITYAVTSAQKRAEESFKNMGSIGSGGGFRGYATGGFPEKGQYFYARENGIPEMVGTIGTKTAVANNVQIVDAVSQGVEKAMINALSAEDFSPTVIVNLGNEKLYEKQQSFNKKQQNKYGTINLY